MVLINGDAQCLLGIAQNLFVVLFVGHFVGGNIEIGLF
jgi:hypothetical protein